MKYVSRASEIEAVQWTGGDPDPLSAVAPDKVSLEPSLADYVKGDGAVTLWLLAGKDGAQGWVPVPVGHWIVRMPGDPSDVWPVDPGYFAAKYTEPPPIDEYMPESAARKILVTALREQRCAELLYILFNGGGVTVDAVTDTLVFIPAADIDALAED